MTREEKIERLKHIKIHGADIPSESIDIQRKDIEALDMAIKALEQEPKSECQHDHEILRAYSDGAENVLDNLYADIQKLRGCSCSCSDGVIDDVEDILDKYNIGEPTNEDRTN